MANNLGLFQWIRDGVRQSVLLGVSDALESIGSPEETGQKLHPALMSFGGTLSQSSAQHVDGEVAARKLSSAGSPRKRLGRSLKDIEQPSKPTT